MEKGETDLPTIGPTSVRYNQSVWEVDFEKNTLSSPDYPTYHIRCVNAGACDVSALSTLRGCTTFCI